MKKVILKRKHNLIKLVKSVIRWHTLYYIKKSYFPVSCGMYLTNMCNLKCEMCTVWRNPEKQTISFDKFTTIIDGLNKLGCFYLSFAGGEPLLLKDIFDRVTYAKKKIPYVHLVTNAISCDEIAAKEIAKTQIDEVSLSIDGMEIFHDKLRGVKGAFQKTFKAIEYIKEYAPKTTIVINSIIFPSNIDDLYELVKLIQTKKVYHKFQPASEHPVFTRRKVKLQEIEWNKLEYKKIKEFVEWLKKQDNVVNSKYFLSRIPDYLSGKTSGGIFDDICLFGYHHCEIDEEGKISPCLLGMDTKRGFDIGENIRDVIYSEPYKQELKLLEKCQLCKRDMYICYFEPRITFPVKNFLKYKFQ